MSTRAANPEDERATVGDDEIMSDAASEAESGSVPPSTVATAGITEETAILGTRDAHGLYRQFGFSDAAGTKVLMEILRSDMYASGATASG